MNARLWQTSVAACVIVAGLVGCLPPGKEAGKADPPKPQGVKGSLPGLGEFQAQTGGSGGNIKMPKNFRQDIPIYQDATPTAVVDVGPLMSLQFTYPEGDPAEIAKYYQDELPKQGWTENGGVTNPGGSMLTFTKESQVLKMNVARNGADTTLHIMLP